MARLASHSVTLLGWHAFLVLLQERAGHQTTPPYPWHPHPIPTLLVNPIHPLPLHTRQLVKAKLCLVTVLQSKT